MSRPPPRDLRRLLRLLRREGELVEVQAACSPRLEIPEIHRRVIAAGGPALLFLHPSGSSFPVVTNLFGSRRRVELALGADAPSTVARLASVPREILPPAPSGLWRMRDVARRLWHTGTRTVRRAPVTECLERPPHLEKLPLLTCWKGDGGAFATLPVVYTEHPDTGISNLGMYRLQRYDGATTGMHWQIGRGGGFHHERAAGRGEPLPVTVFLGGPPSLVAAAIAPLPENVPELLLASWLLRERLRTCANPAGPHPLVADAEFAAVGSVPPFERREEGPFGDHYGAYSLRHPFPVFHVEALLHRRDAILPATVVGKPRQEDFYLGDFLQELLSPIFPLVMPGVRSLWSYGETGYHPLAAAVVHERHSREAMSSAFRILGEGQLSLTKLLLLTDRPVDLRDFRSVLETVLERFHPETDLYILPNLSMDTLDYAGPSLNRGSKAILAGTGEPWRELPRELRSELPPGATGAVPWCGGCVVVGGPPHDRDPDFADALLEPLAGWPLAILVDDPGEAARSTARLLWTTFTRFDPAADIHVRSRRAGNHLVHQGCIVIDARWKQGYPDELHCDPETAALVERRWEEYFPGGGVEMGDSERADLG